MPQARDEAGNIWEVDAQGSPVRLVSQGGQGPVTMGTPNPYALPKQQGELQGQSLGNQGKALDNTVTQATMQATIDKARADAAKAAAEAATAQANAAAQPSPQSTQARANLGLDEVLTALANAKKNTSGWSTGTPGQFLQGWGGTQARDLSGDLSTIGSSLTVDKLKEMKAQSATGASGMGALSEKEGALLRDSVASLDQFQSQDKVKQSLSAIELHYRRLRAIQDGQNPDDPNVQHLYGITQDNPFMANPGNGGHGGVGGTPSGGQNGPNGPDAGPQMTIASGNTRTEHSDRLSAKIDAMMNAGASIDQINAVMQANDYPPINPAQYSAARDWMAKHPDNRYSGGSADRQVPMSFLERTAGSPLGAFLANMANDFTAGSVGALAGAQGQGALDAMRQLHPTESGMGSLVGGVAGAFGGEGVAAKLGAGRFAARVGDMGYGSLQGFNNAPEGEGLKGAILGAGIGGLGGALGERVGRYAGGVLKGVTDPAIQRLQAAGVPLTIGQILSRSGTAGKTVKGIEDALTSVPLVGNVIDARRGEGMQAFNDAAFREAGSPIGYIPTGTGQEGIAQLAQAKSAAYDNALGGTGIDVTDPRFVQDVAGSYNAAQAIPPVNGAQDAALQALQHRITGAIDPNTGAISGRNFQEAYRGLARTAKERKNLDYGYEVGAAMRQGQDALASALEAQNPGSFQAFVAANKANRNLSTLADAVNAAQGQEQRLFTPIQLGRADANATTRLSSRIAAMSGNSPFAQLASDGISVLPSRLGDSGTAKRAIVGAGTTGLFGAGGAMGGAAADGKEGATKGAGYGAGAGILTAILLSAGGSKTAQKAAAKALLDRPDIMRGIGASIQKNVALARPVGSSILSATILPSLIGNNP